MKRLIPLILLLFPICLQSEMAAKDGNLSCTILFYGSCGRNDVELTFVNDLIDAADAGPSENINLVTQYNFACNDKSLEYVSGTSIMCLKRQDDSTSYIYEEDTFKNCKTEADSNRVMYRAINEKIKELVDKGVYSIEKLDGDRKKPLYHPADIASFIDRAAEKYPADRYMLCIEGHGGGWYTYDDPVFNTGGVAWDDNFHFGDGEAVPITAKNLAAGINMSKNADKVQCLYLDACKMNRIENICEYAKCPVKYTIASFQSVTGGDHDILFKHLKAAKGNTDEAFKTALIKVFKESLKDEEWDVSIINTKKMAAVCADIRNLVPLLAKDYQEQPDVYNYIIGSAHSPEYDDADEDVEWFSETKDLSQMMYMMSKDKDVNAEVASAAASVYKSIKNAIVMTDYGIGKRVTRFANVGVSVIYSDSYLDISNNEMSGYRNSEFYKASNWNRLFEILVYDDDEEE